MRSHLIASQAAWASSFSVHPWNLQRSVRHRSALKVINVPAPSFNEPSINIVNLSPLQTHIADWASCTSNESSMRSSSNILSVDRPPTNDEIKLLQSAFAAFYGADKDVTKAVDLLTKTIDTWKGTNQGGDEIAGLLRVRGDAFMELMQSTNAEKDYGQAIDYLDGIDGDKADPEERPAARLGRARSVRSMGMSASQSQAIQASKDYEKYFTYISQLDTDDESVAAKSSNTISEVIKDGIQRNPYAAWEWGMVNRVAGQYETAQEIHRLAANAFEAIGDKPRATISRLDGGIDLASGVKDAKLDTRVKNILIEAIDSTVGVDGRDVQLLQRVVTKEGEARIALSGLLWGSKEKSSAESQFGTACARLDELNRDYNDRLKKSDRLPLNTSPRLGFSIDDIVGAEEASCSRFKNENFVKEKLVWSQSLQSSVKKFFTLSN